MGDLSESDSEDKEDFAAENRPRPLPEKILCNGNGMSVKYAQDVFERRDEPPKGRSNSGVSAGTTNESAMSYDVGPRQ